MFVSLYTHTHSTALSSAYLGLQSANECRGRVERPHLR